MPDRQHVFRNKSRRLDGTVVLGIGLVLGTELALGVELIHHMDHDQKLDQIIFVIKTQL